MIGHGHWTSDIGHWTLDNGHWTLDIDWILDIVHWTMDIGHCILDIVETQCIDTGVTLRVTFQQE